MAAIFIYLHSPTGTVHLTEFTIYYFGDGRTLCGQRSTMHAEGDETPSGHLATCKTCLARKDNYQ